MRQVLCVYGGLQNVLLQGQHSRPHWQRCIIRLVLHAQQWYRCLCVCRMMRWQRQPAPKPHWASLPHSCPPGLPQTGPGLTSVLPVRSLADTSCSGRASTAVAFSSGCDGLRCSWACMRALGADVHATLGCWPHLLPRSRCSFTPCLGPVTPQQYAAVAARQICKMLP